MAKKDLTLWEVDEADKFSLTADQYDELKNILEQRVRQKVIASIRQEVSFDRDQLKKEIEREIRPKLREEITVEVKKDLQTKFNEEQRLLLRKQIETEIQSVPPSTHQCTAAKELVRAIEIDCLTAARVASEQADEQEALSVSSMRFRSASFYTLLFSVLPALAYIHVGWGWSLLSISFLSVAIPYVVATGILGTRNIFVYAGMQEKELFLKGVAGEYWTFAQRAEEVRRVRIDTVNTKGELVRAIEELSTSYARLLAKFAPSAKRMESARHHVRSDLFEDMDPEKLMAPAKVPTLSESNLR